MFSNPHIAQLIKAQVVANGSAEEKVSRIVSALSVQELREIAFSVIYDTYSRVQATSDASIKFAKTETIVTIDEHGRTQKSMVVTPVELKTEFRTVPRDSAGQLARQEVRSVEQAALTAYKAAFTRQQRLASFVYLKQFTVAVGSEQIPWHELTSSQREERTKLISAQIGGLSETRQLLDAASYVCREYGVQTLAEAEAADLA